MREIIFRGKSNSGKWVYGSLVYSATIQPSIYFECGKGTVKSFDWCYVDPDTVGQYTGLCDKHGNKIFEGDIVDYHYVICEEDGVGLYEKEVTFLNGCFCLENDEEMTVSYAIWASEEYGGLEVVGNIYDMTEGE